jgi:hypothetical protein
MPDETELDAVVVTASRENKLEIRQTLQFRIVELTLILSDGSKFDISSIFEEINLYDNLFTPCMSASITIRDANNLFTKLKLKGDEKIYIQIDKGSEMENMSNVFDYKKIFSVYKISNRLMVTPTSQIYTLHLINEDFIYSLQKKVDKKYKGKYSEVITNVLTSEEYLNVPNSTVTDGGSGIGNFEPSKGDYEIIVPFLNPFETIEYVTKRAVNNMNLPNYVFYENKIGYNFVSLSTLFTQQDAFFDIQVRPKNVGDNLNKDFLGAREFKILTSFDVVENVKSGAYAGKFLGFDTITRTQKVQKINDAFSLSEDKHANDETILSDFKNKANISAFDMYDSRVVTYPFQFTREQLAYIKENNPAMSSFVDNTQDYVFQRKSIFANLMQRRIQLVMPGNFGLLSGYMVNVTVPKFAITKNDETIDETVSGKYIIIGARHIIRYNKHETIIEVATDSVKRK